MDPEVFTDIAFPTHGVDNSHAYGEPLPQTTVSALNARTFEAQTQRGRGGSRPGLARFITDQVPAGTHLIQHLNFVVDPDASALLDSFDWPDDDAVIDPSDLGRGLGRRIRPGGSGRKASKSRKKTPIITWSNPADITQGTALSGTQLNAVARDPTTNAVVAGSYLYSPAAGTVLDSGDNQALRVTFTPSSPLTYNTIRKTVHINVTAGIKFEQANLSPELDSGDHAVNLAYTTNVKSGSLLLVAIGQGFTGVADPAVTDSRGNVYTKITELQLDDTAYLFYAIAGSAGANTVTVTPAGGGAWLGGLVGILEYSGTNATPLDSSSSAGDNTGTALALHTGTVTVGATGEMVLGVFYVPFNPAVMLTKGSGFNSRINQNVAGINNAAMLVEDKLNQSANLDATATASTGSTYQAIGASFKKA